MQQHRTNGRAQRAAQIMEEPGFCSQFGDGKFRVRSQSDASKHYVVSRTGAGLACECPDHLTRGADCKHIKVVLEVVKKNRGYKDATFRIMERDGMKLCKFCDSGNVVRAGTRKNRSGDVQVFKCRDCRRRFSANYGFERMRHADTLVTRALQMYYAGMSARDIEACFAQEGIEVSHVAIYKWVAKYSGMTSAYLSGIVPRVGDWFRADEVWVKIAGRQNYLFASMDDDTRFWLASDVANSKFQHNADSLLAMTKRQAAKAPRNFITDGLPAYGKSSRRVFGKGTNHVRHIHLRRDMNNNKMERLNGEIRDREKVFRGLKKMDTAVLDGMRVYYNFAKRHSALGGRTPAEASKIEVDGPNKWRTIIQNASLSRATA